MCRGSSPDGGARKGVESLLKRPLLLYGFSRRSRFPFEAPSGGAPAGRRGYIYGRRVGFDQNNAGASLYSRPPQRDPIFRDAKVLLFWCDQQQKEHWLDIPFCCHIGWVCTRACKWSLVICRPLTSNTVWCPVFVISNVLITCRCGEPARQR